LVSIFILAYSLADIEIFSDILHQAPRHFCSCFFAGIGVVVTMLGNAMVTACDTSDADLNYEVIVLDDPYQEQSFESDHAEHQESAREDFRSFVQSIEAVNLAAGFSSRDVCTLDSSDSEDDKLDPAVKCARRSDPRWNSTIPGIELAVHKARRRARHFSDTVSFE